MTTPLLCQPSRKFTLAPEVLYFALGPFIIVLSLWTKFQFCELSLLNAAASLCGPTCLKNTVFSQGLDTVVLFSFFLFFTFTCYNVGYGWPFTSLRTAAQ